MSRKILIFLLTFSLMGGAAMAARMIDLPRPRGQGKMSVEESIARRRSERDFSQKELNQEQISQILWAAQGITDPDYNFRAAPSAGALYPLILYAANKDGFFKYLPKEHKLEEIFNEDMRPSLVRASLGQSFIREAPLVIIIAANFEITQSKYGPRAFRYVFMEIGHAAENIHLQAVAMGLGSVPVGAFWNDVVKSTLKLPEEQEPLYIIPVGYPK